MLTGNSWLVTPSLFSSYYWYAIKDYGETEGFLKFLRREKTPTTKSQQAGIDFENRIRAVCEGREEAKEGSIIEEISDYVKGGFWQANVKKELDGNLLYMYCSGIPNFKYLISDGKRVYVEAHSWSDSSLDTLKSRIYEMLRFFEVNKAFKEAFEANWRKK